LDFHLDIVKRLHANQEIILVGYCQGGTMTISFMGRRAEEFLARNEKIDIKKVVLMASPVFFDDNKSGHGQMQKVIKTIYDPKIIEKLFKGVNVPAAVIQEGLNEIQPGSFYKIVKGFYERSFSQEMIRDAASFLYWIYHGTKFPTKTHTEWTKLFFIENQLFENKLCLPSPLEKLNGKPVNMDSLRKLEVAIMDYRGSRDPISPPGSCVASEHWGLIWDHTKGKPTTLVNRTIEKYMGHVFVVSKKFLDEFIEEAHDFCQS
jgi:poly(3-hydroxyalkanoate) synthetase